MKKLNYFGVLLLVVTALISFTSCEKAGVYNPKKKISKIFSESSGGGKQLEQIWSWDGNLLSKIDYGGYSFHFSYEGKQVSKIISSDGETTIKFNYDGSKFNSIEETYEYEDDYWGAIYRYSSRAVYQFTYNGKKVEKITVTNTVTDTILFNGDDYNKGEVSKAKGKNRANPLQLFLPEQTCKNMADFEKKYRRDSKSTSVETYTITFTWNGNNIEKEVYEITEDGEYFAVTNVYTHDNESNPFGGLFTDVESSFMTFSKNNITKLVSSNTENDYEEYYYSYKYESKFPVERIETNMDNNMFYAIYYEYE